MKTLFSARFAGALAVVAGLLGASFAQEAVQTRVSLTSQPSGATLIVDGLDRGTTPTTLFDLTPGRHHVKYRLAGYVERNRFIMVEPGPCLEKNEVLQEEMGLLLLKTEPEGCDIRVNGVSIGRTPRLITNLAAKDTHSIRLLKAGYQDQVITVKFEGRKPLVREETLVPDAGAISITSEPLGADVVVNGVPRGKTPVLVRGIPKGRAVVKFSLPGFREEVRELAMRAGEQQNLPIVLEALPGTLHLISDPDGARFYVNDEPRGPSPLVIPGLKPGDYVVRAEKAGYGTVTKTVTIDNGASAREEFKLSNVMGRIELRTEPAGATVILDGRTLGTTRAVDEKTSISASFPIENVLEGEHTLVVRKEGYAEWIRHPKVENSKTTPCGARLQRLFIPDIEIVTDNGSYRGVLVSRTPEMIEIEVSLGINRTFRRAEIREIKVLMPDAKP